MNCTEPGCLPGSYYYFFSPSEQAQELFYYPVWIGHYFCTQGYCIDRQSYPQMLLAYVHSGEFHIKYRGQTCSATRGDLILLDCTEPHHYSAADSLEFSYIHFLGLNSRALVRYLTQEQFIFRGRQADLVGARLEELLMLYHYHQPPRDARCSALIYEMLIELEAPEVMASDRQSPVNTVIRYIQQHFSEHLTLDILAGQANLSPFHFARMFKKQTGYAPLEYVLKVRLDTAKCLLKTTRIPIESIALQVGYGSSSSFANMFTQKVGLSPSQFRKFPV